MPLLLILFASRPVPLRILWLLTRARQLQSVSPSFSCSILLLLLFHIYLFLLLLLLSKINIGCFFLIYEYFFLFLHNTTTLSSLYRLHIISVHCGTTPLSQPCKMSLRVRHGFGVTRILILATRLSQTMLWPAMLL